jgi:penicillin-binding protein 1C
VTARIAARWVAAAATRWVAAVAARWVVAVAARWRRALVLAGVAGLAFVVAAVIAVARTPLPAELRETAAAGSVVVTDLEGRPLREVRAGDGTRGRWVTLAEVPAVTRRAVLAAEDARFYDHPGVDPFAVARAGVLAVWRRRIVSGASTLTMQLARLVRPHEKTLRGKLGEMVLALRIERSLTKDQILEQYLNRATFGPNLRGIGAASDAYFDKSVASLSTAESALLAGLPRGPSLYEVTRHVDRARRRRDRVLDRMGARGWLDADALARAKAEPTVAQSRRPAFGAPHFVAGLVSGSLAGAQAGLAEAIARGPTTRITSTLDADLQRVAEAQVASTVEQLRAGARGATAASAVVLDNASGDVLAYVGSPDMFDEATGGANDGVRAERQPGSTLKPLLYELAMEKAGFDPATLLPDVELHLPVAGGVDYAPRDYDGKFRGPVRLREALGSSLNVPAVWTAEQVGVDALLDRLHALGFASLTHDAEYYGPGLALGDGEVTLLELARAYATLARGGLDRPLRLASRVERAGAAAAVFDPAGGSRVMLERDADLIVDVLKDHDARVGSFGEQSVLDFPFEVAAKTGTSKGYRDNWTVGFTRAVTVAVWAGNFDGAPMTHVSGITGAGPLFHAIMEAAMLGRPREALPVARGRAGDAGERALERVDVCALSGELAGPDCPHKLAEWLPAGAASRGKTCTMHARVRIDRRNGLRAGPACARDEVDEGVVEQLPPEYAAWAAAAGRPVAPAAWSPNCPAPDDAADRDEVAGAAPRIVYPLPGARFVIDPDRPRASQRLDVQIVAPVRGGAATLVVDGEPVAPARGGADVGDAPWTLREGEHELVAEVDGARSPAVRVSVRSALTDRGREP